MTVTMISSLLLISFSPVLLNNTTEASTTTDNSSSSLLLSGIISSLILDIPLSSSQINDSDSSSSFNITNIQKFILAGDWNMRFDDIASTPNTNKLQIAGFEADFMGITTDGKGPHTHQISNFKPVTIDSTKKFVIEESKTSNHFNLSQDVNASILGTVDVGINGQKIWDNVNANITISEGKTIEILLDDRDVDYHFGKGQAIYGLVIRSNLR